MIILLLLFLSLSKADDVLQFGDSDFSNKIAEHEAALVMFFAPWCGHCKRIKPEFEKAASVLKGNDPPVHLVKVDCTEDGKDTCTKYGVSGYPTLKIFKGGELSSDYNGPREFNGIVKYMKSQVGPASKELKSIEDAESFINKNEVAVVYFGEGSLKDAFMKVADKMRETVRFGHSTDSSINEKYGHENTVVLFRPALMANKFEPSNIVYKGSSDKSKIEDFINKNFHGLVGHRTPDTVQNFPNPLIVAYFSVDYVKNPKGTNYWRNRILKVAQSFKDDFNFAISSKDDFQHELTEFGLDYISGEQPVVCAKNAKQQKFVMQEKFTVENFESFLKELKAGNLEPHVKSEPLPENEGAKVKVAVAKNFDDLVTDSGRDALIEFYAPWCGHCKKLTPTYEELGEKMMDEDVDIVKMDATANDVPSAYNVRGFPTLYWKPKSGDPIPYDGGRELDDFVKYIAKHSSQELRNFDRKGKAKEPAKEEL